MVFYKTIVPVFHQKLPSELLFDNYFLEWYFLEYKFHFEDDKTKTKLI